MKIYIYNIWLFRMYLWELYMYFSPQILRAYLDDRIDARRFTLSPRVQTWLFPIFFYHFYYIIFFFLKKYLVHGTIKSWFMNYLNKNTNDYILFMYYIYVVFAECLGCHIEWQHSYFCLSTRRYFCSIQHLKKTFFVKK